MEVKTNEELFDVSALIDERFGKQDTSERAEAEGKAYAFYTGQIIEDARKKAKISQAELAGVSVPTALIYQEWRVGGLNLRYLLSIG